MPSFFYLAVAKPNEINMPRLLIAIAPLLFLLALALNGTGCGNPPFAQGQNLYLTYCANCHMEDGTGLGGNIPPLARADYLAENQDQLACIIRYGQKDTIVVNVRQYSEVMEGIPQLTEFQIANIINYINQAWGNDFGFVKVEDLRSQLEACER
jgi:mono/diheme cytochrome c family protein